MKVWVPPHEPRAPSIWRSLGQKDISQGDSGVWMAVAEHKKLRVGGALWAGEVTV